MQALAIVFAGVFGYYKFLRGRTFAYRAELSASTEIVQVDRADALRVRAILRNTGPARIPMRLKRLRVSALVVSAPAEFVWERVMTVDVFAEHHWVESQETISDEVLIALPSVAGAAAGASGAYQIEFVMFSKPRRRLWRPWKKRVLRWSTEAVVVRELKPAQQGTELEAAEPINGKGELEVRGKREGSRGSGDEEAQRDSDEQEIERVEREDAGLIRQREASEDEVQRIEKEK